MNIRHMIRNTRPAFTTSNTNAIATVLAVLCGLAANAPLFAQRGPAAPPRELDGRRVAKASIRDGVSLELEDGSWCLIRRSGTEPLTRIYAESGSPLGLVIDPGHPIGKTPLSSSYKMAARMSCRRLL